MLESSEKFQDFLTWPSRKLTPRAQQSLIEAATLLKYQPAAGSLASRSPRGAGVHMCWKKFHRGAQWRTLVDVSSDYCWPRLPFPVGCTLLQSHTHEIEYVSASSGGLSPRPGTARDICGTIAGSSNKVKGKGSPYLEVPYASLHEPVASCLKKVLESRVRCNLSDHGIASTPQNHKETACCC